MSTRFMELIVLKLNHFNVHITNHYFKEDFYSTKYKIDDTAMS